MERLRILLISCDVMSSKLSVIILMVGGCIKIKQLVHPLVFYVSENAIYVKRSKFSFFPKIFDSQSAKSEIKAKTDRFGAYFPHFWSV